MDSVCSLKREAPVAQKLYCILCQKQTKEKIHKLGESGKKTLHEACQTRRKLRDVDNRCAIDRVDDLIASKSDNDILYHGSCYATFTSKSLISRLSKAHERSSDQPSTNQPNARRSKNRNQVFNSTAEFSWWYELWSVHVLSKHDCLRKTVQCNNVQQEQLHPWGIKTWSCYSCPPFSGFRPHSCRIKISQQLLPEI